MADAKITYNAEVIAEINGGQTATLKCKGMKMDDDVTVESLGGGGTDERFKQLVEGTITEIDDSEITTVKTYAFYACNKLLNVRLPNITKVGGSSFSNCKAMISFCALNVTEVGYSSFSYCENLKEVIFPKLRTIGQMSFNNSIRLETADLGTAEQMGSNEPIPTPTPSSVMGWSITKPLTRLTVIGSTPRPRTRCIPPKAMTSAETSFFTW